MRVLVPCHLGHMVPSRVGGVGVGGRGFELGEESLGRGRAWGMMSRI